MTQASTVVSAMASHLPTGEGSPVSIHGLPALKELEDSLRGKGIEWVSLEDLARTRTDGPVVALWDFGSLARLPSDLETAAQGRVVAWSLESPLVAHRGANRTCLPSRRLKPAPCALNVSAHA